MDYLKISEFSFLYFQCFCISLNNTAEQVTTVLYPDADAFNLSCWNTSQIQILKIDVPELDTSCPSSQCVLNSQDKITIEDNCNGRNSCLVYYNFTSTCLRDLGYTNLSYTCKHENNNSVSTFEDDNGDWVNGSFTYTPWQRNNGVKDHTNPTANPKGYSMTAFSYYKRANHADTARIGTDRKFMTPICLSLWYHFINGYDCSFTVLKTFNGTQSSLFSVDCISEPLDQWTKLSLDIYEESPYEIVLEADFQPHNVLENRVIRIDDTLIAYRPCQGQPIETTCQDINLPITVECETQFLSGSIQVSLKHENLVRQNPKCQTKTVESRINTFCQEFNKSDQCEFRVLDLINGYEECAVIKNNVSVTYQCVDNVQTTTNTDIATGAVVQSGAIAAGVGGGVVLAIIAVVVIYRIKRSKPGKQRTGSSNSNKTFDELQYDGKCQQKSTLSDSTSQDKTNSTLNTPEQLYQDGQESADLYNMSNEDGTYDVSSNDTQRGNPNDNNIYSHTADNIYDSGSHHKLPDRNEETYDHFFGQQTEDEYDTTART